MCRRNCGGCSAAAPAPTLSLGVAPVLSTGATQQPSTGTASLLTVQRCPWWWLAIAFAVGYAVADRR